MGFFDWDHRYDIGVAPMNDDHKRLMELMSRLHSRNTEGASHSELGRIVDELGAFTRQHFAREEAFMERIGYPGIANHKVIHKQLVDKLKLQIDEFDKARGGVPEGFFRFLKHWLSAHILGIDVKYAEHAQGDRSASAAR